MIVIKGRTMYETLRPVKFKECNLDLGSRPLSEAERSVSLSDNMIECSCYTDGIQSIMLWKTKSWRARIRFLFNGEINVIDLKKTPSPKALTIGSIFSREGTYTCSK